MKTLLGVKSKKEDKADANSIHNRARICERLGDGFLNDLVLAGERKLGPILNGENDLIDAFLTYVSEMRTNQHPLSLFKPRRKKT